MQPLEKVVEIYDILWQISSTMRRSAGGDSPSAHVLLLVLNCLSEMLSFV
jgi:hypothetical protein